MRRYDASVTRNGRIGAARGSKNSESNSRRYKFKIVSPRDDFDDRAGSFCDLVLGPGWRPMDSPAILFHPTRADGAAGIRRSRQLLARLRDGWRPDDASLATARHAEQWT